MRWLRAVNAARLRAGLALALALASFATGAVAGVGDVCELQLEVYINETPVLVSPASRGLTCW
jgi:hypothetical protein